MELSQHWEEATEATNEDAAQLKRDNKYHARTSYGSLVIYTKVLAVNGCFDPVEKLSELGAWLSANRSELPAEIEDEKGNQARSNSREFSRDDYEDLLRGKPQTNRGHGSDVDDVETTEWDDVADLEAESGLYYLERHACYLRFADFAYGDAEYKQFGKTFPVWVRIMQKKALAFDRYYADKHSRLRWRGMEEFQSVTKALAYIDDNVSPRAAQSHAEPLPTQAELHALFDYDGVSLTWAVSRGRIRKGKPVGKRPMINGVKYIAGRIVHMHRLGIDPANATISYADGDPSNVAWDNLRVERLATKTTSSGVRERARERTDSQWRARFEIDNKEYSLGEYKTQQQAETAYGLAMRTFIRFA